MTRILGIVATRILGIVAILSVCDLDTCIRLSRVGHLGANELTVALKCCCCFCSEEAP